MSERRDSYTAPGAAPAPLTWLDVVDEALADLSVDPERYTLQVSFAHELVQSILQGHAPLQRLLEEAEEGEEDEREGAGVA
jgi:hypothetical protein